MRHYLFSDYESGEDFIVGAKSLKEAKVEAATYFGDPSYICELSDIEAECSGLDEY